jgi:uncharacterized protein (TIGR02453 family)
MARSVKSSAADATTTLDLAFLRALAAHNDKTWFDAHKERYEHGLRDPMLALLGRLEPRLKHKSKHLVVDVRPQGGSLSRIYRDTRFSKDKSPYKTELFARIWHDGGGEGGTPGLFLRVEPGGSFVGAGVWQPDAKSLARIRHAIDDDSAAWLNAKGEHTVGGRCRMAGESLKRPPPGFAADHPLIEDLKRKDFALALDVDDARVIAPDFDDEVMACVTRLWPFLRFVTEALGLEL